MFEHPVAIIINIRNRLEESLKENKKIEHLSKENVEDMQKTISYLAKEVVEFYEKDNKK